MTPVLHILRTAGGDTLIGVIGKEAAKVILIELGMNTIHTSFEHLNRGLKNRRIKRTTITLMSHLIKQHYDIYGTKPGPEELRDIYHSAFEAACRLEGIEIITRESKDNV